MGEDEKIWERENEKSSFIINIINCTPSLIINMSFIITVIISCCRKVGEDQETIGRENAGPSSLINTSNL